MGKTNLTTKSYIVFVNYSEIVNWSVRYLIKNSFGYNKKYNLFKISDFLQRNRNTIAIKNDVIYSRVTIKLYNKGVQRRDKVNGENIGTKKQYLVKSGQFIISKIDARNGAFGIVPEYLDKAITTSDFLSYDIDVAKINPGFLKLLTSTKQFLAYCQGASSGTTGRQRINEKLFLNVKIPLPPLEKQNHIVEAYRKRIEFSEQQKQDAKQLEQDIESYLFDALGIEKLEKKKKASKLLKFVNYSNIDRWDAKNLVEIISKYPVKKIESCIENISTGTTPPTSRREYFDNGKIHFYTPADLSSAMYLTNAERKITKLAIDDRKARRFSKNTLLFVGIGSTVGKVGIIANDFATSNQQITGLIFNKEVISTEYAFYYFNDFKSITVREKTQATIPIVNQEKILNIPIPVPPLKIQTEIANTISKMKFKIKTLQQQADENRKKAIEEFEKEIFQ